VYGSEPKFSNKCSTTHLVFLNAIDIKESHKIQFTVAV